MLFRQTRGPQKAPTSDTKMPKAAQIEDPLPLCCFHESFQPYPELSYEINF